MCVTTGGLSLSRTSCVDGLKGLINSQEANYDLAPINVAREKDSAVIIARFRQY
jgi:hypothetical protein